MADHIIIDTPEGIEAYRMLAMYHALKLEIQLQGSGMRHSRGSVMKLIKESYGIKGGTKRTVLRNYHAYLVEKDVIR